MHPFEMKAQRLKISTVSPFTCLFNLWCKITTLEEEGHNITTINHHKVTINNSKPISNAYYAHDQEVPFPSYSTNNIPTVSSVALCVGNPDPELIRRICIRTSTQLLGPSE